VVPPHAVWKPPKLSAEPPRLKSQNRGAAHTFTETEKTDLKQRRQIEDTQPSMVMQPHHNIKVVKPAGTQQHILWRTMSCIPCMCLQVTLCHTTVGRETYSV
jgi:hypothetical protein